MNLPPVPGAELKSIYDQNTDEERGSTPERRQLLIMGQTGVTFNAVKTGEGSGFAFRDEHSDGQGDDTAEDFFM